MIFIIEIFIIVLKSQLDRIKKLLLSYNLKCRFHYVQISEEEEVIGTADSLRKIKDKVKVNTNVQALSHH